MIRDERGHPPRRWGVVAFAVVAALAASGAPRAASASCGADAEARSAAIRRFLDREATRAHRWDLIWGVGLGVTAVGQAALIAAEWHPLNDYDDDVEAGLYVGAAQSLIASSAHFILPLNVARPGGPTGDACADLATAERALRETAADEKGAFIKNHIGNVVFSASALLILGLGFDAWEQGATSAATSYATGLLATYTQPRASWKAVRRGWARESSSGAQTLQLRVAPMRSSGFTGLVLGGVF